MGASVYRVTQISFAPDGSFAVAWSYVDIFWEQDPYYGTISQVFGAEHNVVEFFTSDGVPKGPPQTIPGRQPDVAFDPAGNVGVAYFELSPSQSDPTLQNVSGISIIRFPEPIKGQVIIGGSDNDTMVGGAGNDTLVGGGGNDTFVATTGDGNDRYDGAADIDTYDLSATTANAKVNLATKAASSPDIGTDTLISIENVIGGSGNDSLTGDAQDNVLIGGSGNDTLNGGAEVDTLAGGKGNDTYYVDNAADVIQEALGEGVDTVLASGSYMLAPDIEIESLRANATIGLTLIGNAFSHSIIGNAGNDVLIGGDGKDTLNGGVGADIMAGGNGNDTYIVDNSSDVVNEKPGQGSDTVAARNVSTTMIQPGSKFKLGSSTLVDDLDEFRHSARRVLLAELETHQIQATH